MIYVALLRGVNVGGSNKVDMKELKTVFEEAGMDSVRTYINSGNVIFSSKVRGLKRMNSLFEGAITKRFRFDIKVILRDINGMRKIVSSIPAKWTNDQAMRCDVMFLMADADKPSVVKQLQHKPELEEVRYVPGALIWRVDRESVTRSGMMRLAGTPLYKRMTIRNCNTARKLLELMEASTI
jgi:uncharacterized protein (DUF1697 family)